MTPYQEDKQTKNEQRPEQTVLQGGHTEGPEMYENMISMEILQRDAN